MPKKPARSSPAPDPLTTAELLAVLRELALRFGFKLLLPGYIARLERVPSLDEVSRSAKERSGQVLATPGIRNPLPVTPDPAGDARQRRSLERIANAPAECTRLRRVQRLGDPLTAVRDNPEYRDWTHKQVFVWSVDGSVVLKGEALQAKSAWDLAIDPLRTYFGAGRSLRLCDFADAELARMFPEICAPVATDPQILVTLTNLDREHGLLQSALRRLEGARLLKWLRGAVEVFSDLRKRIGSRLRATIDLFQMSERAERSARADQPAAEKRAAVPKKGKRHRKPLKIRPLTTKQTEALKIHGECKGNLAEVARRMGIDRTTAKQHVEAAMTKLGRKLTRDATRQQNLRHDRRGQVDLSASDDRLREQYEDD